MADITKIVRNNSGSVKTYLGQILNSSDTFDIPFSDFRLWAEDADVLADVASGDLIVNDGTSDLNATDGGVWIRLIADSATISVSGGTTTVDTAITAADGVDVQNSGVPLGQALTLNFADNVIVTDNGNNNITVTGLPPTGDDLRAADIANTSVISITTSFQDIPLNSERVKDSIFTHATDSPEVTINLSGRYVVHYSVGVETVTGNGRTQTETRLVLNGVEVPNSRAEIYNRNAGQGGGNASRSFVLDLLNTDTLKLQVQRESGSDLQQTISGDSSLVIVEAKGPEGLQGVQGDTGPQGLTGPTGPTGPQGIQGDTGPQGPIGLTGADGADGLDGATGPQGPQGPQGLTGNTGAQGPIGLTGPQGVQGDTGPAGADGLDGAQGPQGIQGDTGATGFGLYGFASTASNGTINKGLGLTVSRTSAGVYQYSFTTVTPDTDYIINVGFENLGANTDTNFFINNKTTSGFTLTTGVGDNGGAPDTPTDTNHGITVSGDAGPQGITNTYQIWLSLGNTGTEQDFINTLVGPQGVQGDVGPTGPQGPQGIQGAQGDTGPTGPQGDPGADGLDGATGPQGPQGATGAQGPQAPATIALTFAGSGTVNNEWLRNDNRTGNGTPQIINYDCELFGITFSSSGTNDDPNIEIHTAAFGTTTTTRQITFQAANARYFYVDNFTPVSFNPGDKLGIYVTSSGGSANNVVVTLYLRITDFGSGVNVKDNTGGNLSRTASGGVIVTV